MMKTYYPYFNLFYKEGINIKYYIEMLVKIPGKCYKEEITQSFDGEYWEVRLKLREKKDEEAVDKIEEYNIELTPEEQKQLNKIKIVVKNYDNLLRNEEHDGEGKTGSGSGEIEP